MTYFIALLVEFVVAFAVTWGPEFIQALGFANYGLRLTGLSRDAAPHWLAAIIAYALAGAALERYFPRLTYGLRLALCGVWSALPVIALASDPVFGNPVYLAIAAVVGGLLGSRVNLGSADALPSLLQSEAAALAHAVRQWRARPPLAAAHSSQGAQRAAGTAPRPGPRPRAAAPEPPRASGQRPHSPPPRNPPRARAQAHEPPRFRRQEQAPPPPPSGPPDAWTTLGVPYGSTPEQIRRAYLELMRRYHPDRVATLGSELRELAEHKAKEINRAYETLRGRR